MKLPSKIIKKVRDIARLPNDLHEVSRRLDILQKAVGRIELKQQIEANDIQKHEFQVYSQWGEDGIIQFLLRKVKIEREIFVEFGVENYLESNTRFLLQNNNWAGLIIDSTMENIQYIKQDIIYWRHNLKVDCTFIDKDNINYILQKNGITGDIGLLSIDIDGNDYWIWEAINHISPRVVICEYNSLFGPHRKVVIPYNKSFIRHAVHSSGCYYGASIAALTDLAKLKGYSLVGSNSQGVNLFFVRSDLAGSLPTYSPEQAYVKARFRDSRDAEGNLTCLDFEGRLRQILDMPLLDLDMHQIVHVRDLWDTA